MIIKSDLETPPKPIWPGQPVDGSISPSNPIESKSTLILKLISMMIFPCSSVALDQNDENNLPFRSGEF